MENKEDITKNKELNPALFLSINKEFIEDMKRAGIQAIDNTEEFILSMDLMLKDISPEMPPDKISHTLLLVGSFLGETLCKIFGGEWQWSDKQERWVVSVKNSEGENMELNVFYKIEKRIKNGMEDSVEYWYKVTKDIIYGEILL